MSSAISKETIQRLLKDVKEILRNPLCGDGIYYSHDEVDMFKGYAMLVGPEETPYFGGYYLFTFSFPTDYPFSPPIVTFKTGDGNTRFNPNLYKGGKVCVSILNTWHGDKWSSCQTIKSILLSLYCLFTNTPLENEPGVTKSHIDLEPYYRCIEYKNLDVAVCNVVKKVCWEPCFDVFYENVREHFVKNYENLLEKIRDKKGFKEVISIGIYGFNTPVNYELLENKMVETYTSVI